MKFFKGFGCGSFLHVNCDSRIHAHETAKYSKKEKIAHQSGINKTKAFDGFPVQIGMEHLSNCKHFDHKAVMTETRVSTVRET